MAFGYPVSLELRGRRCIVIGAIAIRQGKVEGLLAAGADDVLVVGAGADHGRSPAADLPGVRVEPRPWRPSDMDGAFLVIAASADPAERDAIGREARSRRALVNVVDDVPNCDWAAPSLVRRGDLMLAISTGGGSPALSRAIRLELEETFGSEWSGILLALRQVRDETLPLVPGTGERARRWRAALDLEEARALARGGRLDELRARVRNRLLRAGGT